MRRGKARAARGGRAMAERLRRAWWQRIHHARRRDHFTSALTTASHCVVITFLEASCSAIEGNTALA